MTVVETIAPGLVDRVPVLTLHDAIFCRADDLADVEAEFDAVFNRRKFPMVWKTELWLPECEPGFLACPNEADFQNVMAESP